VAKKREYLGRAGDAAQAAYANAAAIDYFERLAPLVDDKDRVELLLKLGKVVELVGDWKRAEEVDTQALALAVSLDDVKWRASGETALAEVARKQGRFDEALERLDRAARGFETVGDESGVGLVKHLAGTVAAQRGDYPKAVENYEASLVIRERIGDKVSMGSLLSNLGIIAEYRGNYETSRRLHERALQLRTDIGDRRGIGNSTTNLGMIAVLQKQFADARDWFRKSMLLNREVGDAWMVALCDHNLANATRGLGEHDAARSHYAASLSAYRSYEDAWALAFLLEDVGMLVAATGNVPAAHELLGAADALRDANDMPRAPSRQQQIERELLDFATAVPQQQRDACRAKGRTMGLHAAVDYALDLCGSPTAATR
jgi:tetratricopeptide (TPR) repeat protein